MKKEALLVIDIQNDITPHYKEIVENINTAIDWAVQNDVHVVYIKHENIFPGIKTFRAGTFGAALVSDMKIASDNIFTKHFGNALSSKALVNFIHANGIDQFYIAGADATACVKSTCRNLRKAQYNVYTLADCITSYDKRKIDPMLQYYASKGCHLIHVNDLISKSL